MHLKQPGFTYSAYEPFRKNKKRIEKSKETGDSKYIYQNELDKACFQHDMTYGDFKDLPRRTAADKVLRDKAFNFANTPKYDRYQRGLASMVYKFFDKKAFNTNKETGINSDAVFENKRPLDLAMQQLAKELLKPIIRKFEKLKVNSHLL